METPIIPVAAGSGAQNRVCLSIWMATSFFGLPRVDYSSAKRRHEQMARAIILVLSKNAMSAADFFKIPINRVVRNGTRIEI